MQLKLDYTLQTPQQRNELVKQIVAATPPEKLSPKYLQILADYIIFAMTKQQKKEKIINTQNRMVTINKREMSFEGLVTKFENGEDGIYNLIINDKNIIFTPKISITPEDLAEIPPLRALRQAIETVEHDLQSATGRRRYSLKKQLIQMRKDQYVIKTAYNQPIYCLNAVKNFNTIDFRDNIKVEDGIIYDNSLIALTNPAHISALLCNYVKLKEDCYGKFEADSYYLMQDLENLVDKTLKEDYPFYYSLLIYKIDGKQNAEIQKLLQEEYGIKHSIEYISSLWRKKIPKMIAETAQKDYLTWYYTTKERGRWKKCSKCGQIKLAHNMFFSKNKSSKDGLYSICKCCRNKKTKQDAAAPKKPKIIKRIPYIKKEVNNQNGKENM